MKGSKFASLFVAIAAVAGTESARAATISVSDTAPVSYDAISNPYSAATVGPLTNYIDYTDNGTANQGTGQTFTIPTAGLTINSLTLKVTESGGNALASTNITVGIHAVDGNDPVNIYRPYGASYQRAKVFTARSEAATGGALIAADSAAGDNSEYVTFTFQTPIVLAGGSQTAYAFSVATDSPGSAYIGFALNNFGYNANDVAFGIDARADGTTALGLNQNNGSESKVFYINATSAVPEPASLGLVGVSVAGLLRRRRR